MKTLYLITSNIKNKVLTELWHCSSLFLLITTRHSDKIGKKQQLHEDPVKFLKSIVEKQLQGYKPPPSNLCPEDGS